MLFSRNVLTYVSPISAGLLESDPVMFYLVTEPSQPRQYYIKIGVFCLPKMFAKFDTFLFSSETRNV